MKTVEEKVDEAIKKGIEATKKKLFTQFCNATDKEKQEEARLMTNLLAKLTFDLKKHINTGN